MNINPFLIYTLLMSLGGAITILESLQHYIGKELFAFGIFLLIMGVLLLHFVYPDEKKARFPKLIGAMLIMLPLLKVYLQDLLSK